MGRSKLTTVINVNQVVKHRLFAVSLLAIRFGCEVKSPGISANDHGVLIWLGSIRGMELASDDSSSKKISISNMVRDTRCLAHVDLSWTPDWQGASVFQRRPLRTGG